MVRPPREDFDRLRLGADIWRPGPGRQMPGAPAFVGRVTSTAPHIGAGKFLLVEPMTVLGAEAVGGPGILSESGASIPVYLIGGKPETGDDLVCRFVDYRWVAERGAAEPEVPVIDCQPCSIPRRDLDVTYIYTPVGGGDQVSANFTFFLRDPPGPFPVPTGTHWWEIPQQAFPANSPLHSINCPRVSARMYCAGGMATAGMSLTTHTDDPFGSCFGAASNASGSPGFFDCDDFFITFLFSGFGIGRFIVSEP